MFQLYVTPLLSGIPFENIRLAYTHTHSGPITFGQWIKEGIDLANDWWNTIPGACATAVKNAKISAPKTHCISV